MNLTVSPQMRIVALVGLIAALGLAVFVMLGSRKHDSSSPSDAVTAQPAPVKRSTEAAPAKPVRPTTAPSRPQVRQVPPAVRNALRAGLPAEVAREFARHDVVLVELYSAEAPIDQLALTEATAGARKARAGFVALDVTAGTDKTARALVTKLGVLDAPMLLVFKQPGTLFARIGGFSDQETVAQAAVNAAASTPAAT
jgi:thiol:disulfide interchange protein